MKTKVVVGMSGGVDSSVAAWLLQEQGYEVIGVTMQLWPEQAASEEGGCCGLSAVEDARQVAELLGISHYVMDFRDIFREKVIDYFVHEYVQGRTPNPCIACNRHIKWEALLRCGQELGAERIATGHYAQICRLDNGRYALRQSATQAKDQTYALYQLTQEQLGRTLMPVGAYPKEEVRRMAADIGLSVADKKDSQEICFIPDHDYAAFIEGYGVEVPPEGNFVSAEGEILGRHRGITHYTVGQRKGLGLAFGEPRFVTEIRPETDEVVLGTGDQVYSRTLSCRELNWMAIEPPKEPIHAMARVRYRHAGAPCILTPLPGGRGHCEFLEPVRAITPGQAVVFYDGELVLGGGVIE